MNQSISQFTKEDQRRLILFINDKLPLRASKSHPHMGSPLCPSCQHERETPKHFLECRHRQRIESFAKLKHDLSDITQRFQLHPCIFTAIWLGLTSIHTNEPYPDILEDILHQLVQPIQLQTRLGWKHIFHGRLSTSWALAIDEIHPNLATTGEQIMTKMMIAIWKYNLDIWKVRNHHLHHMAADISIPNYHQAAQSLYEQRHQLPPTAQEALFRQPIDNVLNLPGPRLQSWVQRGHAYFNQQLKAAKNEQP